MNFHNANYENLHLQESFSTYNHKTKNCYLCHICGYKAPEKAECFECKSSDNLILIGPGVERIREEISNLFPNASAKIFSSDNLSTGEKNLEDMDKIKSGAINIIIGTQLVAKGYNFPHLKLVIVLDADTVSYTHLTLPTTFGV